MPFLSTTIIRDDITAFARKISSSAGGTEIHISNEDDLLFKRVAELANAQHNINISAADIGEDNIEIVVVDANGDKTDKGKGEDDWMPAYPDWYRVFSTIDHIDFSQIKEIEVYFKIDGTEYMVTIPVGEYPGDLSVRMTAVGENVDLLVNGPEVAGEPVTPPEPTDPAITDFTKTLVETAEDAQQAGVTEPNSYDYPDPDNENKVIIPYGESVTLLYAITVEGKGGTAFTVTDKGAKLVSTGTDVTGDAGTFTGTIPTGQGDEEGTITFYVSKTFTAENLGTNNEGNQVLTNTASITSDDGVAPDEEKDTEETPAEEESYKVYTYVRFVNKDGTELTEDDKAEIQRIYGGTVNNDGYVAIGTFEIPMPDPTKEPYAPDQSGTGAGGPNVIDTELWQAVEGDLIEANFTPKTGITIDLDDVEKWIKLSYTYIY